MTTITIKYPKFSLNVILGLLVLLSFGCNKLDTWLDEKSDISQVRPSTLKDFRAILDYAGSGGMNYGYPGIGLVGADNYYMTDINYNNSPETQRNAHIWAEDVFITLNSSDWTTGFSKIAYSNIVLDGLNNIQITESNRSEYNEIQGSALFFRAYVYYGLAQLFCNSYVAETAGTDLGLPIRTFSDVNISPQRSTVEETYRQIIDDLENAMLLLPAVSGYQTRPSKAAAAAVLAKTYLVMEDYQKAYEYASLTLEYFDTVLDFNSELVSTSRTFRFPAYPNNPEVIFWATNNSFIAVSASTTNLGLVDELLFQSYEDNDLRKTFFYLNQSSGARFRGTYSGVLQNFGGIATNEILLIKAESACRLDNIDEGLSIINSLLDKRYATGEYSPKVSQNAEEALRFILQERRKELPFTSQIRWEDLRRLNKDERFAVTITRELNGNVYTLLPNDKRYILPIPKDEVEINGLQQNER